MTPESTESGAPRDELLVGAVAASPAIVTIWDGFKRWLDHRGLPFDYILYSNYDRMVADLIAGRIDAAWNDPFASIRALQVAEGAGAELSGVVARDIDFDLTSVIAVRAESGIGSVNDLRGRTMGVGAPDSVESLIMPCGVCDDAGLVPGEDFHLRYYSDVVGTHGADQEGELRAARALVVGEVDAAGLASGNYEKFLADETVPAGATRILTYTPPYDHCSLSAGPSASRELIRRMQELFLGMDRADPDLREAMELENVREWKPARLTHYRALRRAMEQFDALQQRREARV